MSMTQKKTSGPGASDGFTLIELLVVIAIIAMISTIAVPNLKKFHISAQEKSVVGLAHTLQMAVESYHLSTGGYPSGSNLHIAALATTLIENGDLKSVPINPFTAIAYTTDDSDGKLQYSYDSEADTYEIEGFGVNNEALVVAISN